MSKTNINFNNKTYQIDDASLSTASAALKQHLSTVMNGTGATINLGGTAYGVDSAKLQTATNDFVSHLGTIAGSGHKVNVNGVEYGIDSTRVAGAISDIEAVLAGTGEERLEGDGAEYYTLAPTALSFRSTAPLNELQDVQINGVTVDPSNYTLEEGSTIVTFPIDYLKTLDVGNYEVDVVSESKSVKGGFTVAAPELNEHGFYYNQPYTAFVPYFGENETVFIREGGVLDIIGTPSGTISQATYTISGDNITVVSPIAGTLTGTISVDGSAIFINELATSFGLTSDTSVVADNDYVYLLNENGYYYIKGAIDKTKSSYATIRTGINGLPTKYIDEYAFSQCTNLTSITIPSCIEFVLDNAFRDCFNLEEVIFENCMVYCSDPFPDSPLSKGVTKKHSYFKNDYVCDICGHCEHLHTEVVDKTDDYSGDIVCKDCGNIVTNGTYRIPNGATYYIDSTGETLNEGDWFPQHMKDADKYTYRGYVYSYKIEGAQIYWHNVSNQLPSVDAWLEDINGEEVRFGISGNIIIPDGITSIGSYAFNVEHNNITSVTIPDSVASIGDCAFMNRSFLTNITFNGTVDQWNAITFGIYWNKNVPADYVQCSDGQVAL